MVILSFCIEIVLCKTPDCIFGNSNLESVRLAGEWIKYSGISKSSTKPESQGGRLQTEKSSFQYLTPSKIKRWASIARSTVSCVSSLLCPVWKESCVTVCHRHSCGFAWPCQWVSSLAQMLRGKRIQSRFPLLMPPKMFTLKVNHHQCQSVH